jgi:hypothetical protein
MTTLTLTATYQGIHLERWHDFRIVYPDGSYKRSFVPITAGILGDLLRRELLEAAQEYAGWGRKACAACNGAGCHACGYMGVADDTYD